MRRGFFFESFNHRVWLEKTGIDRDFVQDNHSRSIKGVLRGIHYQIHQAQGKLVRVVAGEVFDVAVDLRRSSSTFGKWVGVHMSAENKKQLWVPEGSAMPLSCFPNQPSSSTGPQSIMLRNTNAASSGTTLTSALCGLWIFHLSSLRRMPKEFFFGTQRSTDQGAGI